MTQIRMTTTTTTLKFETQADANMIYNLAIRDNLIVRLEGNNSLLISQCPNIPKFLEKVKCPYKEIMAAPYKTYGNKLRTVIEPHTSVIPATSRPWFYATELATIYKFPAPVTGRNYVIGVVSFGGGLYGNVDADGVLTASDCNAYWTLCGIPAENHPTVVIKPLLGAINDVADPATDENTLDVQTIGACCPTADTTIILYIIPNTLSNFATIINYMITTPVTVKGQALIPNTISISWGAPEIYYSSSELNAINNALAAAVARGISVTAATGDNGANDGVGGTQKYTDFPSSSPNVIACGGTNLSCPNRIYDLSTVESAWTDGGGGISRYFAKPAYQPLSGNKRQTPDVASVADPATGVLYIVGGQQVVYGGTSVAAPTIAGFLAAINCRIWANPIFYRTSLSNFNDIITGYNGGYYAATGYDNCTGLGSLKGNVIAGLFAPVIRVSSVSFATSTVSLGTGKTYQAVAIITPSDATNKSVTWKSSNTAIAIVSSSGLVTGRRSGSAKITATSIDGNKSAFFTVNVYTSVTGVRVASSNISIRVGATYRFTATVLPSNAANKSISYISQNPEVATISSSGIITAIQKGSTIITATSVDGSYSATCNITVI